jgi:Protein of unknown function (DUF3485)
MGPGAGEPVSLFVAWLQTRQGGKQAHYPKVCLPGRAGYRSRPANFTCQRPLVEPQKIPARQILISTPASEEASYLPHPVHF